MPTAVSGMLDRILHQAASFQEGAVTDGRTLILFAAE